ncbi:amino acid ABC transporter periplasmic amino acid-binding protein [Pseudomonas sp. BAY1663]|nr:amino acid ABC transporter periplasmic amino acid-binding protein [Pseudomonas sp. BAY1663]
MPVSLRSGLLLIALLGPLPALAEPLRAALPGGYRVLSSSATESFEPALVEALAEALGQRAEFVTAVDEAELQLGARETGALYYRAVPAALAATEGGPGSWSDLRSQPFCVAAGSPYARLVAERFAALPREYPSAAHALIGLKLGECQAVVDDQALLADLATLPEWRRYKRLLPALPEVEQVLRISTDDAALQVKVDALIERWREEGRLGELTQQWIDEVAFQAYVLADTLDCH